MGLVGLLKVLRSALGGANLRTVAHAAGPTPVEAERAPAVSSVYDLRPGRRYRVLKDFRDHYGNGFAAGEQLTFRSRSFLPYHGGHTLQFEERGVWLQEDDDAEILARFGEYLALHEP